MKGLALCEMLRDRLIRWRALFCIVMNASLSLTLVTFQCGLHSYLSDRRRGVLALSVQSDGDPRASVSFLLSCWSAKPSRFTSSFSCDSSIIRFRVASILSRRIFSYSVIPDCCIGFPADKYPAGLTAPKCCRIEDCTAGTAAGTATSPAMTPSAELIAHKKNPTGKE